MTTSPARPSAPTLKDVARLAGVSMATASKALNGKPDVSAATRKRVEDVAARLAFSPNSMAQAIALGQTGTVGLLTHDLEGRFSIPILTGAEDAFGEGQMSVFLCDARGDSIRERHHLDALLARRVDGLIVVGSSTNPRPSLGTAWPVPIVYAYAPSDDDRDASVMVDNVTAGSLAVEHLLDIGRTRIAHIGGDASYMAAQDRRRGVDAALASAGIEQIGVTRYGTWTEAWGHTAARAIIESGEEVDAIVCDSDQIARGALDLLHERGIGVPSRIAVIGFDNWDPMVHGARPPLTSIDMSFERIGRRAAELIFGAIDGTPATGVETVAPRLVVRGSTAGRT